MTAAGVMLFMMRMGYDFVAGFVVFTCQKFLQGNDTGDQEGYLGEEYSLGGSKCDDAEEERDKGGDLKFSEGKQREELLDLLLLATGCNE